MHRNTYVCSPHVLLPTFELLGKPDIYLAGQITGVEGYVESAASGILAGLNAARALSRLPGVVPPDVTVLGSLVRYLVETPAKRFSPMNANYGILPPLPERIRARLEKARRYADRARPAYEEFLRGL
jgi:methylenetetrahydrofolate--tRNA-(uracil-5-)-methyltransferase